MAETKISDIIRNSLEEIRNMIDANTVIGNPIDAGNGSTIIPISRVSMGFASGGLDYGKEKKDNPNFGGAGGTGMTVTPVGFLIAHADGSVEMMNLSQPTANDPAAVSSLMEKVPEIVGRIKDILSKKKDHKKSDEDQKEEDADPASAKDEEDED